MHATYSLEGNQIAARAFDNVEANIAIIDREGNILLTNLGWRKFASSNRLPDGSPPSGVEVGANYLAACKPATGPASANSLAIFEGISAVLAGKKKSFSINYPCHAPHRQRWFAMKVKPIPHTSPRQFMVIHFDNTEQQLAEMQALAKQRDLTMALARLQQMLERIISSVTGLGAQQIEPTAALPGTTAQRCAASTHDGGLNLLSKREREVLEALVRGERNSAIAERLQLSSKSISTYRSRVLEKLKVETNAELIVLFHADQSLFKQIHETK